MTGQISNPIYSQQFKSHLNFTLFKKEKRKNAFNNRDLCVQARNLKFSNNKKLYFPFNDNNVAMFEMHTHIFLTNDRMQIRIDERETFKYLNTSIPHE